MDPAVNKIKGVFFSKTWTISKAWSMPICRNAAGRQNRPKQIEVDQTLARLKIDEITPTVVSLQEQVEEICALQGLTPEQRQQIEIMTKSIVNKIAHGPISELRRNAGQPEGGPVIDAIRKIFHLQ